MANEDIMNSSSIAQAGQVHHRADIESELECVEFGVQRSLFRQDQQLGQGFHESVANVPAKRPRHGFVCQHCGRSYTAKRSLDRHTRQSACSGTTVRAFHCSFCSRPFARDDARKRHEEEIHFRVKRGEPQPARETSSSLPLLAPVLLEDIDVNPGSLGWQSAANSTGAVVEDYYSSSNDVENGFLDYTSSKQAAFQHDAVKIGQETEVSVFDFGLDPGSQERTSQSEHSSISDGHDSAIGLLAPRPQSQDNENNMPQKQDATGDHEACDMDAQASTPPSSIDSVLDHSLRSAVSGGSPGQTSLDSWLHFDIEAAGIDYAAWFDTYFTIEDQEHEADDDDTASIDSRQSRTSIKKMLTRMRSNHQADTTTGPSMSVSPAAMSLKRCIYCHEPYEREEPALREHLNAHIAKLVSNVDWKCEICEVTFVREDDYQHHLQTSSSATCCALERSHDGDCEGYPCGTDFMHIEPCKGHHPPPVVQDTWSDHDRFKYAQLLLRLVQLGALHLQAKQAHRRLKKTRIGSTHSLPTSLLRPHSVYSIVASITSFRSEPQVMQDELEALQTQLARTTLVGRGTAFRRGLMRLAGQQRPLATQLCADATVKDMAGITKLINRGASVNEALRIALRVQDADAMNVLLTAGATAMPTMYLHCAACLSPGTLGVLFKHGRNKDGALAKALLYFILQIPLRSESDTRVELVGLLLPHVNNVSSFTTKDIELCAALLRSWSEQEDKHLYPSDLRLDTRAPLLQAIALRDLRTARLLLDKRLEPSAEIVHMVLTCTELSREEVPAWVKLLLDHKANMDMRIPITNNKFARPLTVAIKRQLAGAIPLLLAASSDRNHQALLEEMQASPDVSRNVIVYLMLRDWGLGTDVWSLSDSTIRLCDNVLSDMM